MLLLLLLGYRSRFYLSNIYVMRIQNVHKCDNIDVSLSVVLLPSLIAGKWLFMRFNVTLNERIYCWLFSCFVFLLRQRAQNVFAYHKRKPLSYKSKLTQTHSIHAVTTLSNGAYSASTHISSHSLLLNYFIELCECLERPVKGDDMFRKW